MIEHIINIVLALSFGILLFYFVKTTVLLVVSFMNRNNTEEDEDCPEFTILFERKDQEIFMYLGDDERYIGKYEGWTNLLDALNKSTDASRYHLYFKTKKEDQDLFQFIEKELRNHERNKSV